MSVDQRRRSRIEVLSGSVDLKGRSVEQRVKSGGRLLCDTHGIYVRIGQVMKKHQDTTSNRHFLNYVLFFFAVNSSRSNPPFFVFSSSIVTVLVSLALSFTFPMNLPAAAIASSSL